MVYYLTSERWAWVMRDFLAGWGKGFADRMTVVTYEQLLANRFLQLPPEPRPSAYIFTSLESAFGGRKPPSRERQWAMELHAMLVRGCGASRVLNHPTASFGRYELLSALHGRGINQFAAYWADKPDSRMRFPVHIRAEAGSLWQTPPLLPSREAFDAELRRDGDTTPLLAIEFCETADRAGIYRKYGCFVIGERIVPRHLFFSRNWFIKVADLIDDAFIEEELHYVETNPHQDLMLEVCRMANIGYGRVDYSLLDGQPQIWEINPTPLVVRRDESPRRSAVTARFTSLYADALNALDPSGAP